MGDFGGKIFVVLGGEEAGFLGFFCLDGDEVERVLVKGERSGDFLGFFCAGWGMGDGVMGRGKKMTPGFVILQATVFPLFKDPIGRLLNICANSPFLNGAKGKKLTTFTLPFHSH